MRYIIKLEIELDETIDADSLLEELKIDFNKQIKEAIERQQIYNAMEFVLENKNE